MNNSLKIKFDLKLLSKKEKIIAIGVTILFFTYIILNLGNLNTINLYLYTDILIPSYFAILAFLLYKKDSVSEINNLSIIYGGKKYNKVLLIRLLRFLILAIISYFIFIFLMNSFLYINGVDSRMIDLVNTHTPVMVFLKSVPNLLFSIILPIFLLKITRNEILTGGILSLVLLEEIFGEGSYSYPFSLVINYQQRDIYTLSQFFINRSIILILAIAMFYYVITKINKK